MTFEQLEAARKTLKLSDRASLKEIKERHRKMVKRYHPDSGEEDPEMIRRINEAYEVLRDYCIEYRFCFSHEEFYEQQPEERLREQFSQDPLWGG